MRSLYACLFGVLIACGGGGDSPEAQCEDLLENVCGRAVECGVGFDDTDACMTEIAKSNDCSQVDSVGDSYGDCMADIDDASCQALFPTTSGGQRLALPSSCSGALE